MRERGQLVKKGTLSEDGNMEFWEDGTTTPNTEDAPDEKA
jgi:protein import protein ZIM17